LISTKQLIHALAVEKTLHFKKAADLCNISQSALSTSLNELEKQLGFQVFERDNKKVLVTPIGRRVLEKAQQVKIHLDELKQLADSQKSPLSYPMTIGIIPTIGPFILPLILPELLASYPDIELKIVEEQSHTLVEKVRTGEIDTAILALPYAIEGLLSFEFWEEDFLWVTNKDDPLASKESVKSEEIDIDHLMLLKDGHCLKDHALKVCKLTGKDSQLSMNATSLTTLMPMVRAGMGTTLIPSIAYDQLVAPYPELATLPLHENGPHRSLAFILRPNYSGAKSIEVLISVCKKALSTSET
jgi:LysR family hydrogen peroxide-inducible transcriptional activator